MRWRSLPRSPVGTDIGVVAKRDDLGHVEGGGDFFDGVEGGRGFAALDLTYEALGLVDRLSSCSQIKIVH